VESRRGIVHPGDEALLSGIAGVVCGPFGDGGSHRIALADEPVVAVVNRTGPPNWSTCVGCFLCETACAYGAIEHEDIKTRDGKLIKTVAKINQGVCQGCGTCVALCRSKSIDLQGFTNEQVYAELLAV